MKDVEFNIDALTPDEKLFQRQVRNALHGAVTGFQNEIDVQEHYWNISAAYYMLSLRLSRIYGDTPDFEKPDYSVLAGQLQMYVGILKRHLLSEDYRVMQKLAAEVQVILLTRF